MNQEIMNALIELGKSVLAQARKKGFDIVLLLLAVCGLLFWIIKLDARMDAREIRWEAKLERVNSEWSAALNTANSRIAECERDKYDLSVRVAVLEFAQLRKVKR